MKYTQPIYAAFVSLLLLQGCSNDTAPTTQLVKDLDVLIVLKEDLSAQCSAEVKKACLQMKALVDTLDAFVVKKTITSNSSEKIIQQWVSSHRNTYNAQGQVIATHDTSKTNTPLGH